MHKDNIGQALPPGDIVISVRSSTNWVPKMVVLKHTLKKVVTDSGAYEPGTLLNVTSNLIAVGAESTVNDLRTTHAARIVAVGTPIAKPKTSVRYEVFELYTDSDDRFKKTAPFIFIMRIESYDAISYNEERQVHCDRIKGLGLVFGFYGVIPKTSLKHAGGPDTVYGWGFSPAGGSAAKLSTKTIRELGLDSLPVNTPIATDLFNSDSVNSVNYNPGNFI